MPKLTIRDPSMGIPPQEIREGYITVRFEPAGYLSVLHYERGVTSLLCTVPRNVQIEVSV